MSKHGTTKGQSKGRTSITDKGGSLGVSSTKRRTANEMKTQTSRSVSAGAGTRRGDRRDTHPSFSTGKVSRDGGRSGPLGRSTRKSGPETGAGHDSRRNGAKAKK